MVEHRVPMLRGRERFPDPARSRDPLTRDLVTALATLPSPAPRAHFRAELRTQLVAVAPRLVAEGRAEHAATARRDRAAQRRAAERSDRSFRLAAVVRLSVAALAITTLLLGGAVWLSQGALPGDTLYSLKRAGETAKLALAADPLQRASELLSFASTRVDEVDELLSQPSASAPGPQASTIGASREELIRSTLGAADDDLRQASRLLGSQAVHDRSADPLKVLLAWAPGQQQDLDGIIERIPAGTTTRQAAQSSADLVAASVTRAQALQANLDCSCLGGGGSDALGPLPCGPCRSDSGNPQPNNTPRAPAAPTATATPPAPHTSGTPTPTESTSPTPSPTTTTSPSGTGSPTPDPSGSGWLPSLPFPFPSFHLPTPSTIAPAPGPSGTCTPILHIGPIQIGCGNFPGF